MMTLPDRIATKILVDDETGCWVWQGRTDGYGYACVSWKGRDSRASRVSYHLLADRTFPVAAGPPLNHLCRTPSCLNPDHLEPVTPRENIIRGTNGTLGQHTSRYVGVYWLKANQKWRAMIYDQRTRHLGLFTNEEDAAKAYDDAAERLHGDRTNERLGFLT